MMMEISLLCDEKYYWALASPSNNDRCQVSTHHPSIEPGGITSSFYTTKQDVDDALGTLLDKEMAYMPEPGFAENIESNDLSLPRFRVIRWLLKSKCRLRLSYGTLFLAINYFDRFVSVCKCQEWKDWMVELLSIACLSVASKSFEVSISPPLHEIQMEGLDYSFQSSTIQQMELILLRALDWRISSITPHTYIELLAWNLVNDLSLPHHHHEELSDRVSQLLILALSDIKLTEFRPSVLAASAMRHVLRQMSTSLSDVHCTSITEFLDQDQKENLTKCSKLLEEVLLINYSSNYSTASSSSRGLFIQCDPMSPVTVLSTDERGSCNRHLLFDLDVLSANLIRSNRKRRKRE